MKKLASVVGAFALAVTMIVSRPSGVSAHAEYDHSEPADGSTVAAPTLVKVWFTETVQLSGSSLRVNNAAGQQVDNKDVKLDPSDDDHKLMTVSLPANLPAGTYKVLWETTSADDGDTDSDDFSFTVRAAAAAAPAASPAAAPVAQATPVAKPAGQPVPSPAPAQAPHGLPNTGSADTSDWIGWLALGGVTMLAGFVVLRRASSS